MIWSILFKNILIFISIIKPKMVNPFLPYNSITGKKDGLIINYLSDYFPNRPNWSVPSHDRSIPVRIKIVIKIL